MNYNNSMNTSKDRCVALCLLVRDILKESGFVGFTILTSGWEQKRERLVEFGAFSNKLKSEIKVINKVSIDLQETIPDVLEEFSRRLGLGGDVPNSLGQYQIPRLGYSCTPILSSRQRADFGFQLSLRQQILLVQKHC